MLLPLLVGALVLAGGAAGLGAQTSGGFSMGTAAGGANSSSTSSGNSFDLASGVVRGQVLNAATGLPVPRALVRFSGRAALTSRDGRFEFGQLSEEGGTLQVIKPGYYFSTDPAEGGGESVQLSRVTGPLQLRLYPEALLTGTLTAPDGGPLPNIPVSAMRSVFDDDDHRWMPVAQTFTDAHGRFRLPVPAGDYRLETRYVARSIATPEAVLPLLLPEEGSSGGLSVIRIHSGEEQHFDLRPVTGRTHSVTVALENSGAGFPRVNVHSSYGSAFPVNAVRNGGGGSYILDLPSGSYTLTASMNGPEGLQEAESSITVADRDVSGVVMRFAPVPLLPVEMVVDPGATSDHAKPELQQLGLTLKSTRTDSDRGDFPARLSMQRDRSFAFTVSPGSYRFDAGNNGEWYVKSATYGDADLLTQSFVVAPGAGGMPIRVTVSNQTGSLLGSTALNGDAAACWVYLVPTSPNAKAVMSTRSNSDGRFNFPYVAPGTYQAIAFEHRHSANYRDPGVLAAYSTHVRAVSIQPGDKATVDLGAVSEAEILP